MVLTKVVGYSFFIQSFKPIRINKKGTVSYVKKICFLYCLHA